MALLLAEAARDRALELTPQLIHWPDCVGVACTATIVSHYTRRGDYRAHAGVCLCVCSLFVSCVCVLCVCCVLWVCVYV